ncbi:MAG: Gfo/Idh/MocA family oxidoreductase [Deltaproteobacteria bacterium]|nr:Gfo/Idh/MocA family oxidoreductase [Deltaproteobacteria bacterium]
MRVLVIGFGSIGQRHAGNLVENKHISSVFVYTNIRPADTKFPHPDKIQIVTSPDIDNIDFAIIANQTYKHIETAIKLATKKIPLFIEKPVSHNRDRLDELVNITTKNSTPVFIAYNLRFMGAIVKVKELLEDDTIGKPCYAQIEIGQYLPDWTPGKDYRQTYRAKKDTGGDVALELTHEIDYMRYLFGSPREWYVLKTKVSDLEIETHDVFEGIYKFQGGLLCNVHLDYLQKKKRRSIRIVGTQGEINCSLSDQLLTVKTATRETNLSTPELFNLPQTYKDEIAHFISVVKGETPPLITLEDGIESLKLIEMSNPR